MNLINENVIPLASANNDIVEMGLKPKQRFIVEFFYDYISLFDEICELISVHYLEHDIITDILIWAETVCVYSLSFWINPQIIENTLCNVKMDCADVLSMFYNFKNNDDESFYSAKLYKAYSQELIPHNWFINVTPYRYEQSVTHVKDIIYHVNLKLQDKPKVDVMYYHMVICQYMADEKLYHINKSYIQWNEQRRMCIGNDNKWLLGIKSNHNESHCDTYENKQITNINITGTSWEDLIVIDRNKYCLQDI